jgi:Flp pilus assembly protein TadG
MNSLTFALLGPIFFLLTLGSMEVGRVLSAWAIITNEAREAARYGAVNYGRTDIDVATEVRQRAGQRVTAMLPPGGLTPAPQVAVSAGPPREVAVTVSYQVNLVIPVVNRVLPNPFPLTARSTMRGE